jgi:hypothetical protein
LCLNKLAYAACGAVALLLALDGTPCRGDDFTLTPGLALKQEYNDNIFFDSDHERSSFISTASPRLSLVDRTERLDARIDGRLDLLFYTRDSHLNDVDQSYRGEAKYQLTTVFGISGKASFDHVSRPDSYLDTTGQTTTQKSNRQKYSIAGDLTLTERLSASLGYDYERMDYEKSTEDDYRYHNANLGMVYDMRNLLPMMKAMVNLGYSRGEFSSLTLDQYTATAGFGYNFHELWSVQANGGAIFTHSKLEEQEFVPPFSFTTVEKREDSVGWIGSLTFAYRDEMNNASLNFSRSVQGSYGGSGAVTRTSVVLDLGRKFTYELSGHLGGGYYLNKSGKDQLSSEDVDETTYRFNASLRYDFNRDIFADCYYEIAEVQDNEADTNSLRNMVFLRLSMQYPLFE